MARTYLTGELERLARQPEKTNYNAIILEVGLDTVLVKTPPGAKRVKRTVELAEHIKAKRHLLAPGIPCQLESRQGKLYVVAFFEEGLDNSSSYSAISSAPTNPSLPGNQGLATPRPTATIVCAEQGWLIQWSVIENAQSYEVYWTADPTSRPATEGSTGEPLATTTELEAATAFDTQEPARTYFAVRAIGPNSLKSAYSPWVTDELFMSEKPRGFMACPIGAGYRIDADPLELDHTHLAPGFDHWELEWADDDQGTNGVKWGDVVPDDLPKIITSTSPDSWTFDTGQDESWGHLHTASPSDWNADGATSPGSRIVYDGGMEYPPEIPEAQRSYNGRIIQAMQEFTGLATDQLTAKIKVIRASGSGPVSGSARLGAGVWTTSTITDPTGTHDEYQEKTYEKAPFNNVSFTSDGDWAEVTLTLPPEAVGQPVGFITIKVFVEGVPCTILIDDIHWGPGGVRPAKEKWFRLRAMSCSGLAGPWTDWTSGWADLVIFTKPDHHGTVHADDRRYRFEVGQGYVKRSEDAGQTYTDITTSLPYEVGRALTSLDYFQVLADPVNPDTFYILARWPVGSLWNLGVLKTTDKGLTWAWTLKGSSYGSFTGEWNDYDTTVSQQGWQIGLAGDSTLWWQFCSVCQADPNMPIGSWIEGYGFNVDNVNDGYCEPHYQGNCYVYSPDFAQVGANAYFRVTIADAVGMQWHIYRQDTNGAWSSYGLNIGNGTHTVSVLTDTRRIAVHHCSPFGALDNSRLTSLGLLNLIYGGDDAIYPIWSDVNLDGTLLAVGGYAPMLGRLVVRVFDISGETFTQLVQYDLGPATLAEVQQDILAARPRFLDTDRLLAYGRIEQDDGTIVQAEAIIDETTVNPLVDDSLWSAEDRCGALILNGESGLFLVRHVSTLLTISSITTVEDVTTIGYTLTEGLDTDLAAGLWLHNPSRGTARQIASMDTGLLELTLEETAPAEWVVGDTLDAQGIGELWTGDGANVTAVTTPTLAIEDLPLTVNPDGIAVNFNGDLVLGNRVQAGTMLLKSELPHTSFTGVTENYSVGAGVVAVKWFEGGCALARLKEQTGTIPIYDDNGDLVGVIKPPSGPGQVISVPEDSPGGGSGTPTWRQLHHHELAGLGDDDHPQYLNQARGDARYYTEVEVDTALAGKSDVGHTHPAGEISAGTTNFSGNLSAADDTVQKALETLDQAVGGDGTVLATSNDPTAGYLLAKLAAGDGIEIAAIMGAPAYQQAQITASSRLLRRESDTRPGVIRLYRQDADTGHSVQTYWDGTRWVLQGYNSSNVYHAPCRVGYADSAGNADTVDGKHEHQLRGYGSLVCRNAYQSIPWNTWTTVDFSGGWYHWNEVSLWDGATAFYAQQQGWHWAYGSFTFGGSAGITPGNDFLVQLLINGSQVPGASVWHAVANNGITLHIACPVYMTVGQYIQFQVFQVASSGAARNVGHSDVRRYTTGALIRL